MRRLALILIVSSLSLTACDYLSGTTEDSGSSQTGLSHGTVIIDRGDESTLVEVEIAQTPEQRQKGLMERRSLPPDQGMAFIFFERTAGGFWMKNTRIPLSIAFFGREGEILRILDMDPCRKDPCKVYNPGVSYWGALEVNQGAFDRWGAEEGDVIRIVQ
ncbi:MAG TPA: DUF192 domain-containing protein [Actinomycetota bacterium]|jgi:uncharacterized membrane protein (UPF0127 family)|nr:DUF192 domain-containing protein [Actinomycetota bacterium]